MDKKYKLERISVKHCHWTGELGEEREVTKTFTLRLRAYWRERTEDNGHSKAEGTRDAGSSLEDKLKEDLMVEIDEEKKAI